MTVFHGKPDYTPDPQLVQMLRDLQSGVIERTPENTIVLPTEDFDALMEWLDSNDDD